MIQLSLVGIGSGNPEHLTLEAIRVLESADVILLPRKGQEKSDLADLRRLIVQESLQAGPRIVEFDYPVRDSENPRYIDGVNDWHDALADIWSDLLTQHTSGQQSVALMVWGDPSLYDSTLRIVDRVRDKGLDIAVTVVPGITSLQMLTAAHTIPLNTLAEPVLITTGRQLSEQGWPAGIRTVAVFLDGKCSFQALPAEDLHIWWGAYVGMPDQVLRSGPLAEVASDIVATRQTARTRHGWIMDIYILRKNVP